VSLLESIPGVGSLMNRWFAAAGDAGVMFVDNAYVTFKGLPGGTVEIKLPVAISLSARRRITITENEGLADPIKYVTKSIVTDVTMAGRAATWRKATLPPIPAIPVVGGAAAGVLGSVGTLLGTSEYLDKMEILRDLFVNVLKAFDAPVEVVDSEGFLDAHDVTHLIPLDYQATPQMEEVAWVMRFVADSDEDPLALLFPEEE
jgi:hypothetical protein